MNRTIRTSIHVLPILTAGLLAGLGCSSSDDNQASVTNTGGTSSATGGAGSGGEATGGTTAAPTGGTTAAPTGGTTAAPTGGTTAAPTGGTTAAPTGGTSTETGGDTGSGGTPTETGGDTGSGGDIGSGGTTEATGGGGSFTFPDGLCGTTLAGESIGKGVACTADDQQLCDKTCGPANVGYKTEECNGTSYAEGDCTFPSEGNYACFALPDPLADATTCPDTAPQHNEPCDLTLCETGALGTGCAQTTPCEICGFATGYLDSKGSSKEGYCVCIAGADDGGKWACGSTNAWPCPAGNGC
ncbi:MAG: hypothetical protein JW940_20290 [Polyangiaceae bacterium]|nr:hypothetical protein [Polyangiaceae bacterium]